jgi:hypothetical protein
VLVPAVDPGPAAAVQAQLDYFRVRLGELTALVDAAHQTAAEADAKLELKLRHQAAAAADEVSKVRKMVKDLSNATVGPDASGFRVTAVGLLITLIGVGLPLLDC